MLTILFAILIVGALGAVFGIGLAFASKVLAVQKDSRVAELEGILPGLNCGACGYAGCAAYAEAIANESEQTLTLCSPGGPTVVEKIGSVMGVEVESPTKRMVTQVYCRGGRDVSTYEFEYSGIQDCNALHLLYGGDKVCKQSCLQLGSCIRVCPVDAIGYDAEGKVRVDKDVCISCGKCIEVCPTSVMKWVPYDADVIVACNNTDPPKVVRKHCKVGCIGCSICAKRSPEGGFEITNFLSTIDYDKNGPRDAAVEKCPPKCIIPASGDLQIGGAEVQSSESNSKVETKAVAVEDRPEREVDEKSQTDIRNE